MKNNLARVLALGAVVTTGFAVLAIPTVAEAGNRPSAQITSPAKWSAVGQNFTISVNASGKDLKYVEAYLMGPMGEYKPLGVDTTHPYSFEVKDANLGKYQVFARSVDENFKTSRYAKSHFYVEFANVVVAAVNTPALSTLVTAVSTAGLVDALAAGNLTVLAPTNDAFAALPAGTVTNLLKPENKDMLTKILTYHVIPGMVKLENYADGDTIKTLQGQMLTVKKSGHMISLMTSSGQTIKVTANLNDAVLNSNAYLLDGVLLPE